MQSQITDFQVYTIDHHLLCTDKQYRQRLMTNEKQLKKKLIFSDVKKWNFYDEHEHEHDDDDDDQDDIMKQEKSNVHLIRYIAGLDVSYDKESPSEGFACLIIWDLIHHKVVYKDLTYVTVTTDYVASFLAYREIEPLNILVQRWRKAQNQCENEGKFIPTPDVWLIDGNGIMHPRQFGLACHFGLLVDAPTIGVAKNPYHFKDPLLVISNQCSTSTNVNTKDENEKIFSAERAAFRAMLDTTLLKRGDQYPLYYYNAPYAPTLGMALRTVDHAKNPLYISVGHRISLESACRVVLRCCVQYKNPEPLRLADIVSREAIRKMKEIK